MKTLSALLFFSLILAVFPAVIVERLPYSAKHRSECYDQKSGTFFKVGETMNLDGYCGRKLCLRSGKYLVIEYQTCGKTTSPKHCKNETDLSLPYPECCGNVICSDNISNETKYNKRLSKVVDEEENPDFSSFEDF